MICEYFENFIFVFNRMNIILKLCGLTFRITLFLTGPDTE